MSFNLGQWTPRAEVVERKLWKKVQTTQVRASGELLSVVILCLYCLLVYFDRVALRPWGCWSEWHVQCKLTCSKIITRVVQSSVDVKDGVGNLAVMYAKLI